VTEELRFKETLLSLPGGVGPRTAQTAFPHYGGYGHVAFSKLWSVHREEASQSVGPFNGPATGE